MVKKVGGRQIPPTRTVWEEVRRCCQQEGVENPPLAPCVRSPALDGEGLDAAVARRAVLPELDGAHLVGGSGPSQQGGLRGGVGRRSEHSLYKVWMCVGKEVQGVQATPLNPVSPRCPRSSCCQGPARRGRSGGRCSTSWWLRRWPPRSLRPSPGRCRPQAPPRLRSARWRRRCAQHEEVLSKRSERSRFRVFSVQRPYKSAIQKRHTKQIYDGKR